MQPMWSIADRERLLEIFCDNTSLLLQYALTLDVTLILDGCDVFFYLDKINTVPCLFTDTLTHRQRADDCIV